MSNTAHARVHERQEEQRQALRLVEAQAPQSSSRGETLEVVGLAFIVLATWLIAAMIFVPGLSGILG
jgi:hypothetical protein